MEFATFLRDRGIGYEKHTHPVTYTAQGLANVEHVSGYVVAKPVVVKGDSGYAMCALAAPKHVNLHRVAEVLHESDVRLATEAEMAELFPECELGAEPPAGALFGLRTIMDTQLAEGEYLVMQAGTHREAIKMRRSDWERICKPIKAPIAGA